MRIALAVIVSLLAGACGGGDQAPEGVRIAEAEAEGELIPVDGDPARAKYQLVRWSEMDNGHREALTRRDGTSGTSYARREIDCAGKRFRYLGEGDRRQEAEANIQNQGEMAELVPGSISSEVAEFVCAK